MLPLKLTMQMGDQATTIILSIRKDNAKVILLNR